MFVMVIALTNTTYGQKNFEKLAPTKDSTFGYTDQNPLKLKKGNLGKSIDNSYRFLSGLKTVDNQTLTLISRKSVKNPKYKEPTIALNNRYTGMPLNSKNGVLDKYVLISSETKDTITLFIDIYNKGDLFLPAGLKFEQSQK